MIIGKTQPEQKPIKIDLDRLIETRMLIEANSGGGKSWAIRKLLEITYGKVQQIVLDIEGDFATLREKYNYILAGHNADIPVHTKSAHLLARKILELNASLIVDLYDLKQHERIRYVKNFLESMINAPKKLWHPVLVIIDEAHIFAPEKGKSESMLAVIDLATRGRKRGYCSILATQRLSKLHKDAAAECINKMIGRTGLDIDMKRAADELGISGRSEVLALRDLNPGEFFIFGPALTKQVHKLTVGNVNSSHPKVGQRIGEYKPTPNKTVQAILSKLVDFPKEAEEEAKNIESLQAKVRELQRELRQKPKPEMDKETVDRIVGRQVSKAKSKIQKQCCDVIKHAGSEIKDIITKTVCQVGEVATPDTTTEPPKNNISSVPAKKVWSESIKPDKPTEIGRCERVILSFLSMRPNTDFTKIQIGAMTGYSHKSGGFNNALSKLGNAGLICRGGGFVSVSSEAIPEIESLLGSNYHESTQHSLELWLNKLGKCARTIYDMLLKNPTQSFTKLELGEETGYQPSSGGFNNAISKLNTLGLLSRSNGMINLNKEIIEIY